MLEYGEVPVSENNVMDTIKNHLFWLSNSRISREKLKGLTVVEFAKQINKVKDVKNIREAQAISNL